MSAGAVLDWVLVGCAAIVPLGFVGLLVTAAASAVADWLSRHVHRHTWSPFRLIAVDTGWGDDTKQQRRCTTCGRYQTRKVH